MPEEVSSVLSKVASGLRSAYILLTFTNYIRATDFCQREALIGYGKYERKWFKLLVLPSSVLWISK